MEKTSSLTLLLIITLSSFLSLALSRPINNDLDISPFPPATNDDVVAGIAQSSPRWWFRGGFIPRLRWPLVRSPFRAWPHWEHLSPPRIAGGFRWPHWRFVIPAGHRWPHWEFARPSVPLPTPVDAGSNWPPTTDSTHWQNVQPPMPSGDYTIPAPVATAPPPAVVN